MHNPETTPAKPELPKNPRPLTIADILAREFPVDLYKPHELIGQLMQSYLIKDSLLDWSYYAKTPSVIVADKFKLREFERWGWNPQVDKDAARWLITINTTERIRFGIDALKLGLQMSVDFKSNIDTASDKVLIPYIHFYKGSKPVTAEPGSLGTYGVDYAYLLIMNRWQISELDSIVNTVT
jgi:hypothetical protein